MVRDAYPKPILHFLSFISWHWNFKVSTNLVRHRIPDFMMTGNRSYFSVIRILSYRVFTAFPQKNTTMFG